MVGRAIHTLLAESGNCEVITAARGELDLTNQYDVDLYFKKNKPDTVVLAAAKVGGIHANNTLPGQFIYENLQIQNNVIHSSHINDVNRLLFLGSSCIYTKHSKNPISESELMTGTLEPTNEQYAIAKIAGIKLCEGYNRQYGRDYRSVMPTNLYGPHDNFHPERSHVVPALIRRFHEAKMRQLKSVEIWGTGTPRRELMHISDMAAASVFLLKLPYEVYTLATSPTLSHINVGTGEDVTIKDLAFKIANIVGYNAQITFNPTRPDGTSQKLLSTAKLNAMGWESKISLDDGLKDTYHWFLENDKNLRAS